MFLFNTCTTFTNKQNSESAHSEAKRAGAASFPVDYLKSDYLVFFLAAICSNHCKGVRSLVVVHQTRFIQSDRAINCKRGSEI